MFTRVRTIILALLMALFVCALPGMALAENAAGEKAAEENSKEKAAEYQILKGETSIEKLSDEASEVHTVLEEAAAQVAEMQAQIDVIEGQIPAQQARSDAGMKQRYIMQSNPLIVLDSLLGVNSLDDFMRQSEYWELVSRANLKELNRLVELRTSLDEIRAQRDLVRAEAQDKVDEVENALEKEQAKRARKQETAIENAKKQATGFAGDDDEDSDDADDEDGDSDEDDDEDSDGKDDEDADDKDSDDSDDEDDDEGSGSKSKKKSTKATGEGGAETTYSLVDALDDEADWHAPREEFIEEWTKRIDDYLEGTAMEGLGKPFAEAAWKHNVDPRWSPAISFTESSNGAVCIRPHNAWGWGAADSDPYNLAAEWDSWEEAIDAHVAGLSKGYGYTISLTNARRYCPPNWLLWYNRTLGQMAKI